MRGSTGEATRRAGLVVLVGFLTVGLALWVALLAPGKAPGRFPLAPKSPDEANASAAASSPAGSGLPDDHPPLEIPPDVKKFIVELEQKAVSRPKDLDVWKNAAQVEYRAGQIDRAYLEKAEASFRHVLELDEKNLDAIRGLGNVHFDREEYRKAVEAYARYLAIKPDDMNVRTDLGTMYLYGGDPEKAIAEYDQVLARDPKFYQAHYNLGIAYSQEGQTAKALDSLGRARELAPDERTRQQIDTMIAHAKGGGEKASSVAAGEPKTFQGRVEEGLREHPIVGPKIAKLEWVSPAEARVRLRDFPMQAMPETVRQKFLDRLKGELVGAKRESGVAGPARLDLVDDQNGEVMATVSAE
jgi:tetratricopeptide (TPR) repeat protein